MIRRSAYRNRTLRLTLSVALLSVSIVAYEIQLMHFFTIVQWHHYASMIISVALLGFGASGTLLSLFRKQMIEKADALLPAFMITSGLLMSFGVRLSRMEFLLFDSYLLFVDPTQFLRLMGTCVLFFLSFLTGSLALGLIFVKRVSQIGVFYFADMTGSGFGGLLAIYLLWQFEPADLPWMIALMPVVSGLMIIRKKARYLLAGYGVLVIVICVLQSAEPIVLKQSQYKGISYALQLPEARIEKQISSPYGLVQVVSSPVQRYAPGLSLNYQQPIGPSKVIFNNGNWYAAIPEADDKDSLQVLDYTTMALPYVLRDPDKVLIFHAGAGLEVRHALLHKALHVDAVEPNASVTELIRGPYAQITDSLYYDPRVHVYNKAPRTFLKQSDVLFDLVQLPLSGAFGGSVGLNALHEENLITKEALGEMWLKLTPEGMIVFSSYIDLPPRITVKYAGLIAELLESVGAQDPLQHLVAVRSWATLSYVVKKSPLTEKELHAVSQFCDDKGFDRVLFRGSETTDANNAMQNDTAFGLIKGMFGPDRDQLIRVNDFNISIPTDNRPYFYQFLRLKNIVKQWETLGERAAFLELGYLILLVNLLQVMILGLVLIVVPLFKLGFKGGQKARVFTYFSGLGLGYMFFEIVLIKYFVRFLGHPIYAVATVISIMLVSSGLGSLYASKLELPFKKLWKITALISILIFGYSLLLSPLLDQTVGWPVWGRLLITAFTIGFPAFFMGMPFPLGLQLVNTKHKSQVPWAWGINGCVSVVSTLLAAVLAVEFGFRAVLITAAAAYLLSGFSLRRLKPDGMAKN